MFARKKTCIGLDVGSSAVKVAQLRASRSGGMELSAYGVEPLAPDTIIDGTILNQGAVVDAVRALISRLRIKQKEVALAISGHSVIIKKIFVPAMTDDELEEQIPWEAEQHIPFDKNDVEIDYQVLSGRNAQGQMELLLVAAKKDVVRDYTAVAREALLNPVVVDVASFAMQNAFELAYGEAALGETVALVNVGASISNINIIAGGLTAFTRDVTMGGNLFTDEIKRQLGVSHDAAEGLKLSVAEGTAPRELDSVINKTAERMAGELAKSIDFFLSSHVDSSIAKIYLAGGGARIPLLQKAIAARAHVPVEPMDPFRSMVVTNAVGTEIESLHDHGPQAAVAVGLALRTPGDKLA